MAKKKERNPANKELIKYMLENYEIKSTLDIQEALKDMFSETIETMLNAELDVHLGYDKNATNEAPTANRRNGTTNKNVNSQLGEFTLNVPRDRESTFEPELVAKRQRDISGIEEKVLAMYAKGFTQRDIEATIRDIYKIEISHETVSKITDKIIPLVQEWRSRPLKAFYPFVFIDALFTPVKTATKSGQKALYSIIGIDVEGRKEVLGFWLAEEENSRNWLQILEELKRRGVEDILFVSLDGLSGLTEAVNVVFPYTITQRCIVHLQRNATRYIPRKQWAEFAKEIKEVYKSVSLDEASALFKSFCNKWSAYPSAIKVWEKNWDSIERLFEYPSEIRKIIYTTNTIESYHNQLRKVTNRKGAFPNEMALFKLIYLRIQDVTEKWDHSVQGWAKILNQLVLLFEDRVSKYIKY